MAEKGRTNRSANKPDEKSTEGSQRCGQRFFIWKIKPAED
jgi:hypothetical protein